MISYNDFLLKEKKIIFQTILLISVLGIACFFRILIKDPSELFFTDPVNWLVVLGGCLFLIKDYCSFYWDLREEEVEEPTQKSNISLSALENNNFLCVFGLIIYLVLTVIFWFLLFSQGAGVWYHISIFFLGTFSLYFIIFLINMYKMVSRKVYNIQSQPVT